MKRNVPDVLKTFAQTAKPNFDRRVKTFILLFIEPGLKMISKLNLIKNPDRRVFRRFRNLLDMKYSKFYGR